MSSRTRRGSSFSSSVKQPKISRSISVIPRPKYASPYDFAEARRQVLEALHLHKASKSPPPPSSPSSSSSSLDGVVCFPYYSTQLVQPMPMVDSAMWSTTEPSVPHVPYYSGEAAIEAAVEFEWGENQAAAYSWWMAFLKSLDGNIRNHIHEKFCKYPLALAGSTSNWTFGQRQGGVRVEEADEQNISPDEWLMFLAAEDHEGEFGHVIP